MPLLLRVSNRLICNASVKPILCKNVDAKTVLLLLQSSIILGHPADCRNYVSRTYLEYSLKHPKFESLECFDDYHNLRVMMFEMYCMLYV